MTDRAHSLTVVLEVDTRVDDVQSIVNAIQQLRGVATVGLNIADPVSWGMAEQRARIALQNQLTAILWPPEPP